MQGVANPGEFVDPSLLPATEVRVAAFDGENADPVNGRRMPDGTLAYTPCGEIAHALAGHDGFERVRRPDEAGVPRGAATIAQLSGNRAARLLSDQATIYLHQARQDRSKDV